MDKATAERWVTISALAVAGIYAYRRLTEAVSTPVTAKKLIGLGNPVPLGAFATAWGFTFLVIAIMAEASPGLGASFAILIATGDFLTNANSVFTDITSLETTKTSTSAATSTARAAGTSVAQGAAAAASGVHPGAAAAGIAHGAGGL